MSAVMIPSGAMANTEWSLVRVRLDWVAGRLTNVVINGITLGKKLPGKFFTEKGEQA
jgi:hypothetical protein